MKDIIIPYKATPSEEIEWTVRSLRNLSGWGDVCIIGDRADISHPYFRLVDVDHGWSHLSPHHNQISKYYVACNTPSISEELILMNDDMYILKPARLRNYNRGLLVDHIRERRNDQYAVALNNTRNVLKTKGYDEVDYEMHIPMLVNKNLLKQAIEEIIPIIRTGKMVLIRSYYGNRFEIDSEYMEDVKNKLPLGVLGSSSNKSFNGEYGKAVKEALR